MRDPPSVIFRYPELSLLQKAKEVAALQQFHNNVDVVLVFEHIVQPNDVWVLTYFEYFDFSFQ